MKSILISLFFVILGMNAFSTRLAVLNELSKPYFITMTKDRILINDMTVKVHLYDLKNFKHYPIGKKGNGPGEYPVIPRIYFYNDSIFIYREGKCMFFNQKGQYKNEFKIPPMRIRTICPFGKNYLLEKMGNNSNREPYTELSIVSHVKDAGIKHRKLIYYQNAQPEKLKGAKRPVNLMHSYFDYTVYQNMIFVHDNTIGFYVEVYDQEGNQINKINIPYEKQKVPSNYPDKFVNKMKQRGHWEIFKNSFYFDLPEYFPAFYRFAVDNDKLYFLTYNEKDGKRELVVANFKGKILKRLYVPYFSEEMHTYFAIRNDKFYYIKENEDEEQWELHMEDIK